MGFIGLVIDCDNGARMRLRQAISAVPAFSKTSQVTALSEGLRSLTNDPSDVVFLSSRFEGSELKEFIKKGKELKGGLDSAYVIILDEKSQDSNSVALNVLVGADGFLMEPYSVDDIYNTTVLAQKVKKDRSDSREKAAIAMIVQDLIQLVDKVAHLKTASIDSTASAKKLQERCSVLNSFEPEKIAHYYDAALKAFEEARITLLPGNVKNYKGASSRIKKKMEEKVLSALQAQESSTPIK